MGVGCCSGIEKDTETNIMIGQEELLPEENKLETGKQVQDLEASDKIYGEEFVAGDGETRFI